MKLSRVRWPYLQKDLPGEKGALDFVTEADYDLTLVGDFIELIHRATGKKLLIEKSGACMQPAIEKAPVVPVAPEASGSARTVKSRGR
jgi:hypothetical protein